MSQDHQWNKFSEIPLYIVCLSGISFSSGITFIDVFALAEPESVCFLCSQSRCRQMLCTALELMNFGGCIASNPS